MTGSTTTQEPQHSKNRRTDDNPTGRCPLCVGEHGGPGSCDHILATEKRRRFDLVPWHQEELAAAHYDPNHSAASAVRARQAEEFRSLPPRHICSCICPNIAYGRQACEPCRRRKLADTPHVTIEIGRTAAVRAPSPDASILDIVLGLL